jgi:hypothetical protein
MTAFKYAIYIVIPCAQYQDEAIALYSTYSVTPSRQIPYVFSKRNPN